MGRSAGKSPYAPALTIVAGQMPADNSGTPWLSHQNGVGGIDPTLALGHLTDGHHMDRAVIKLTVSVWNAMPGLIFLAERSHDPLGGAGSFGRIEPAVICGPVTSQYLDLTGGVVKVKNTLPANLPLVLVVEAPAAARFRFGFIPSGAGACNIAALVATLETIADSVVS